MPKHPDLILVDGSSYLFRAFHALPPLTNSKGEPTGAIVGVVNMLRKLIREYQPKYMAVVFDAPGKTFRDELYEEYKANRPPAPDELKAQIPLLHQIVEAMGLPLLVIDGVEADDVIGTLARRAAGKGMQVLISTGDKDMAQLVSDKVTLIDTMTDRVLDPEGVEQKFGVKPEQIVDFLALTGDTSDNIPGVPKCGPKTAAKWLKQYGTLDELMAHAGEIKGKVGDNLRASLEQLPLSRELTTIKADLDLDIQPEDLQPQPPDTEKLREIFRHMEASRLLAALDEEDPDPDAPSAAKSAASGDYELILEKEHFEGWLQRLEQAGLFAFDTETTSLNYMQARLVGLSFALEPGKAAYVPLAHDYPGAPQQLEREWVLEKLRPLLESDLHPKLGQNLKYDMSVLARHGVAMRGIRFDTMLESYVLDSTATRHDMDSLAKKYLGYEPVSFQSIAGKGKQLTLRLHQALWPKLEPEEGLRRVFEEIEMPLVPVLSRMERTGVRIDTGLLKRQSAELAEKLHQLEQRPSRSARSSSRNWAWR